MSVIMEIWFQWPCLSASIHWIMALCEGRDTIFLMGTAAETDGQYVGTESSNDVSSYFKLQKHQSPQSLLGLSLYNERYEIEANRMNALFLGFYAALDGQADELYRALLRR